MILGILIFLLSTGIAFAESSLATLRVGHFPNVTHAPALIARARQHFEDRLKGEASVEWKTFNAGPEAVEALFAGAVDLLYVGPNPAINGYVRSRGEALRLIAGVAGGGSGFVVRQDSGIERFEDIQGKRVAAPQKGNTQDVALHYRMHEKGLRPRTQGGEVEVFHLSGGDQMTAFLKNQVDAVWTAEPWLTRLAIEAKGKILFEESELWPGGKYPATVLVARKKFIDVHRDLVQKWVDAHVEILDWIRQNETDAKRLCNEEFERETGQALPLSYLDRFFSRITFTEDPMKSQLVESARRAEILGYLGRNKVDLKDLFDFSFLEQAKDRG